MAGLRLQSKDCGVGAALLLLGLRQSCRGTSAVSYDLVSKRSLSALFQSFVLLLRFLPVMKLRLEVKFVLSTHLRKKSNAAHPKTGGAQLDNVLSAVRELQSLHMVVVTIGLLFKHPPGPMHHGVRVLQGCRCIEVLCKQVKWQRAPAVDRSNRQHAHKVCCSTTSC